MLCPRFQSWLHLSYFPTRVYPFVTSVARAVFTAQVIRIIFCEECKVWNYIRCSILHIPVVLSCLFSGVLCLLNAQALSVFSSVRARNRVSVSCSSRRKTASIPVHMKRRTTGSPVCAFIIFLFVLLREHVLSDLDVF